MEKYGSKLSLTLCIILFHLSFYNCNEYDGYGFPRRIRSVDELNDYIYSLNYSPDEVLAYKGETINSVKRKEGQLDSNKNFIVINREKKTITNGKADLGVVTSNEHRAYPGSLLLANYRLIDNAPDLLVVERSPIKYTVNLPGLTTDGNFEIVPTFANYQSSVNNVLKTWFENYPDDHDVPTLFQSDYSLAYSKEQLRVKFGMEFKNTDVELNTDFSAVDKQEKLIMIHRFKQIFYTVSVQAPEKPGNVFGPKVTRNELEGKFNAENPPVLVDSVSYGRIIYLKIETSSTDQEAKYILENKLTNFDTGISSETDYTKQLKNLNMQVYVMGGGSEHIELVKAQTVEDVNNVIVKYGKFSRNNLGYPISYSCEFIKDNSRAVVLGTSEYTETTRTEHQHGIIELSHTGGYVAQWKVEWDEISYNENGDEVVNRKSWNKNSQDLTAPFETEIELGGNTQNIAVFAKEATGLAWEWWRTVIDRSGIPLVNRRKFSIWGTTLSPHYSIEPDV